MMYLFFLDIKKLLKRDQRNARWLTIIPRRGVERLLSTLVPTTSGDIASLHFLEETRSEVE